MSDSSYSTDDYHYKYRFDRTGKVGNDIVTFYILSNADTVSFEDALKEMGVKVVNCPKCGEEIIMDSDEDEVCE